MKNATEREGNWGAAGGLPVAERPVATPVAAPPSRIGAGHHRNLVAIHDHLRDELRQISQAAAEVASGELDAGAARNLINRMTMRQNRWTLGSFCAAYCRVVTIHHTIEDTHMFPAVAASAPELGPVLHRLEAEHEVIADVLDRFDRSLVALVQEESAGADEVPSRRGTREVERLAGELSDLLLSHLRYEEDELKAGLATLTGPI